MITFTEELNSLSSHSDDAITIIYKSKSFNPLDFANNQRSQSFNIQKDDLLELLSESDFTVLYSLIEFPDKFRKDEVDPLLAMCAVNELLEKNISSKEFKYFIDKLLDNEYILTNDIFCNVSEYDSEDIERFFEEVILLFPEQEVFSEYYSIYKLI